MESRGHSVRDVEWFASFCEGEDLSIQIMIGSYEFADVGWNDVSRSAKSLVSKLMCVEAVWRISLHVALIDRLLD